jgi:hypothetical protein
VTEDRITEAIRRMQDLSELAAEARRQLKAPTPPHLAHLHSRAVTLTDALGLATQRNMAAALVGIFTTGKSLLTSLLVGMPRLLSVANVATTGNVTRLVLRPAPAGAEPRLAKVRLSFLSRTTVADMVGYLLGHIIELVDRSGLPYDVGPLRGHQPVDIDDPARSDWTPLERLMRPVWAEPTMNLELRQWATELFQIRDALDNGAALLPMLAGGSLVDVDADLLDAATRVGDLRNPPAAFPEPVSAPKLSPSHLTTEQRIRSVLPLIHEVVLEVDLPADVGSFGGLPVDLLDFPGLASDSLRDRYLSLAELGAATVMVVVVDARKPKQHDVTHLYTLLQQKRLLPQALTDSVVTVINRFDRLAVPSRTERSTAALAVSEDIAAALRLAADLTRDRMDRVAITSALAASATAGFVPPDAKHSDAAAAMASVVEWRPTAAAIMAAEGDGGAGPALSGYAADGGIRYLRDMLIRHLSTHGVDVWLGEAQEIARQLEELLSKLYPTGFAPSTPSDRARLLRLCDLAGAAQRHYRRRLADIRMVSQLAYEGEPVFDVLRDEAARIVHRWPAWAPAHDRLASGRASTPGAGAPRAGLPGGLLPGIGTLPRKETAGVFDTTAALRSPFDEAASVIAAYADQVLRAVLGAWANDVVAGPEIAALAAEGATLELLRSRLRLRTPDDEVETRLRVLCSLLDAGLIAAGPAPNDADVAGRAAAQVIDTAPYPLSRDRALPWHAEIRRRMLQRNFPGRDTATDPTHLARLRRDLVEALARHAIQRVQAELDLINATLEPHLELVASLLPTTAEIETLTAGPEERR